MKNQTNPQQKTQGKPTKDNDNKQQIQTQDKTLLSPKADVLVQARLRPLLFPEIEFEILSFRSCMLQKFQNTSIV